MVRGWCHNHETPMPLWRGGRLFDCQLCWLSQFDAGDAHLFLTSRTDPVGLARARAAEEAADRADEALSAAPVRWWRRQAEANDTANSPATSTWLPRVWVHDPTQFTTVTHNIRDTERCVPDVSEFLRGGSTNAPVVWFRCVDADVAGVERFAAASLLADQLRREEAGQ